jgi:hypothetical protein
MANKFLIVNNKFLWSSSVKYHFEMLPDNVTRDKAKGGGWWYLDRKSKKFILFSKSEDFGYASKEDILHALDRTLFPEFMHEIGFYITRFDNLADAIVHINDENIQPDWIYDHNSELVVDVPTETIKHNFHITQSTKGHYIPAKGTPIVKENKIGRNDPCGCGSGKKNKKCCNIQ